MTPEVKKRIEQIRQGIVPEGYKKTESGIIPNEWRVGQVSKCIEEYKFFSNDISHIPVYSSSRKGLVPQSDYYNQREAVETNLGYKVVPQGYVTYRHMSDDDVFHFNINKTGENVLVSSEYPVFTSSDNCDLSFLISVLNNTARFRYFCKMQKLGGTRTRLYLDNLKRYALALPPFDEQKKIAEILATQDKAIELQGRKIEELKRFKKGCLEKMFPRKGQKVPEKRFPGFTDDWEQRKVGDITIESTEYLTLDSGLPLFTSSRNGLLYQNEYRGNVTTNNKQTLFSVVPLGACTYRHMSDDDVFHLNINTIEKGLVSREYPVFCGTPNHDIVFIVQHINSSKAFRAFCAEQKMGGTRTRLYYKALCEFTMMVPSFAEQRRISKFLLTIDHLITLHQRKLEEMKRQKKALMQLLLTGIVRVRL